MFGEKWKGSYAESSLFSDLIESFNIWLTYEGWWEQLREEYGILHSRQYLGEEPAYNSLTCQQRTQQSGDLQEWSWDKVKKMTILFLARIEIKKLLLFNKKFNHFVSHPTFIDKSEGFVAYLAAIQHFNERFNINFNFRVYLLYL